MMNLDIVPSCPTYPPIAFEVRETALSIVKLVHATALTIVPIARFDWEKQRSHSSLLMHDVRVSFLESDQSFLQISHIDGQHAIPESEHADAFTKRGTDPVIKYAFDRK